MVRDATEADARAMAEVQVAAWRAAYRGILPADYLTELSLAARERVWAGAEALVAEEDGAIRGFIALALPSRDEDAGERTAEITATYVEPPSWGQGTGGALLRETLSRLGAGDWDDVTLWVFRRNAQGRAFYARSGFRLDDTLSTHEPTGVPTARMRLPLL